MAKKTKENILNTAKQLFYEQGYTRTTTRQIAEKLGISQSNLFYYFKTKDDILKTLMQIYYKNLSEQIIENYPELSNVELLLAYTYVQLYSLYYNKKFKGLFLQVGDIVADILYEDYAKDLYPEIEPDVENKDRYYISLTIFIASQNAVMRLLDSGKIKIGFEEFLDICLDLIHGQLGIEKETIYRLTKKIETIAKKYNYSALNIFSEEYEIQL